MFLDIIFCECGETLDAQALCTVPRGACSVKYLILEQIAGQGVLVALSSALNAVP